MRYLDRLRAEIPASLVDLLRIPGLGPKTVRQLHEELGIETLEDLRQAAEAGRLRTVRGHVGARPRSWSSKGIAAARRDAARSGCSSSQADELVDRAHRPRWRRTRASDRSSRPARSAGDARRSATSTCSPRPTTARAAHRARSRRSGMVDQVVNQGGYKAAVRLLRGPQVDLMVMPPGEAGTYRIHFTGSKEHNVRLRGDGPGPGLEPVREGLPADRRGRRAADRGRPPSCARSRPRRRPTRSSACRSSSPSCARTRARSRPRSPGGCPSSSRSPTCAATCTATPIGPTATTPIEVMAEAARRRGYAYQVLTDHTQSLAIARGLDAGAGRGAARRSSPRSTSGSRPRRPPAPPRPRRRAEGFRLLHGCELEVRADGVLDFDDDLLARFDLVVASRPRRAPPAEGPADATDARRDPQPARRRHRPPVRPEDRATPDDLDLDWDLVYTEAARTGTALEMNGSPPRLDLAVERARRAVGMGCLLSIDSDAHDLNELDYVRWGISQARRAWVEPRPCVNTRSRADLLAWVARQAGRAPDGRVAGTPLDRGPRAAHRDLALVAVTLVGLSRLIEPPLVWLVAILLLGAMLLGALQVLADEASPGGGGAGRRRSRR